MVGGGGGGGGRCEGVWRGGKREIIYLSLHCHYQGFQARSKDQEILEEGGGAGPSLLPRRDHE